MNPLAGRFFATSIFLSFAFFSAGSRAADIATDLFQAKDTVVLMGGTNLVQEQFQGYLETLLTAARPALNLKFRTMAWEADTVYLQQRPLNFPGWNEWLSKVDSTVIITQFGQMESLDGTERLPEFETAYRDFLDALASHARTFILVSPIPFEHFEFGSRRDVRARNRNARAYSAAIKRIARQRDWFFVDLFSLLNETKSAGESPRLTSNGVHLTVVGHRAVAETFAAALGPDLRFKNEFEPLRRQVVKKNTLWFNYWRPTNWAFLHGDRTHVQSSRDHRDMEIRWFPAEVEQHVSLIRDAEAKIHAMATQLQPRLAP